MFKCEKVDANADLFRVCLVAQTLDIKKAYSTVAVL